MPAIDFVNLSDRELSDIVANRTPHDTGLKDRTEADFLRAIYANLRIVPSVEKGNR